MSLTSPPEAPEHSIDEIRLEDPQHKFILLKNIHWRRTSDPDFVGHDCLEVTFSTQWGDRACGQERTSRLLINSNTAPEDETVKVQEFLKFLFTAASDTPQATS